MDPVLILLTLFGAGAVAIGLKYSLLNCENDVSNIAIIDPVYGNNTASEIEIPPRYESPPQYNEVYNGD